MRFPSLVVFAAFAVASSQAEAGDTLSITTFNIQGGYPGGVMPGTQAPSVTNAANDILAANADVVLLQEVHHRYHHDPGCPDQPDELIAALSSTYPYSWFVPNTAGSYWGGQCGPGENRIEAGLMIFSKTTLWDQEVSTPGPNGESLFQKATIYKSGMRFAVYNVHTDPWPAAQAQIPTLVSFIQATRGADVVMVGGDFNARPTDPTEAAALMPLSNLGLTMNTHTIDMNRIDQVWTSWAAGSGLLTIPTAKPYVTSDHPLVRVAWSWFRDNWMGVTPAGLSLTSLGTSPVASNSTSGGLYGFSSQGLHASWRYAPTPWWGLKVPNAASGTVAVGPTIHPNGCELVAWRDATSGLFMWGVETTLPPVYNCHLAYSTVAALPDPIDSSPAVASYAEVTGPWYDQTVIQHYWAFARRSTDGALLYNHYQAYTYDEPNNWLGWAAKTDGVLQTGSAPAAVATAPNVVEIFVRGTNDYLYTRTVGIQYSPPFYLNSWTGFAPVMSHSTMTSDPTVAWDGYGRLDACSLKTDGNIWCVTRNSNYQWSNSRSCGQPPGGAQGAPVATRDGSDLLVYSRNGQNQVFVRRCN